MRYIPRLFNVVLLSSLVLYAANLYAGDNIASNVVTIETVPAISLSQLDLLSFGSFTHTSGGTIDAKDKDPSAWEISNGIVLLNNSDQSTGKFRITGAANETVTISLGSTDLQLAGDTTGDIIDITLRFRKVNNISTLTGQSLGNNGIKQFRVFGTATIGTTQAVDTYTGTYNLSIEYE